MLVTKVKEDIVVHITFVITSAENKPYMIACDVKMKLNLLTSNLAYSL